MAIIALHSTQQFIARVIKYGILIEIILSSQSWLLKARIYLKVVVNVIHLELLLARVFTDLHPSQGEENARQKYSYSGYFFNQGIRL